MMRRRGLTDLRKVDLRKSPMRTERSRKSVSITVNLTSSCPYHQVLVSLNDRILLQLVFRQNTQDERQKIIKDEPVNV
jgi:hypothetical protein